MTRFFATILFMIFIFFENCVCMEPYNTGLETAIRNKTINIICLRRKLPDFGHIFSFDNHKIDEIFEKIEEKISTYPATQWTLVVFSEYFFGEINPLNNSEVTYIVEKCNDLTNRHKRVVMHVNFLHKFNVAARQEWMRGQSGVTA